ncbi:MAG: hypothetical protein R2824_14640 [Saprospiraceae bacterium]
MFQRPQEVEINTPLPFDSTAASSLSAAESCEHRLRLRQDFCEGFSFKIQQFINLPALLLMFCNKRRKMKSIPIALGENDID